MRAIRRRRRPVGGYRKRRKRDPPLRRERTLERDTTTRFGDFFIAAWVRQRRDEAEWSGIPESNRRLYLGRVAYCRYTNPARAFSVLEGSIRTG